MSPEKPTVSKKMLWAGYITSALPVFAMLMSGSMKLMQPPDLTAGFAHLGWPMGYAFTLGIVELSCVVIYLIPRTAVLGAILMTGYLGGAVATHARLGEMQMMAAAFLGVLVWGGLWFRDVRVRELIPFKS